MTEKDKTDTELLVLKYAGEMLNMSEASKLGMLQRFMEIKGLDSRALPVYAEKRKESLFRQQNSSKIAASQCQQ